MNPYSIFPLLSMCIALFMAVYVFFKNKHHALNRLFLFYCLCFTVKTFVDFCLRQSTNLTDALFWNQLNIFWPFISGIIAHFTLVFMEEKNNVKKEIILFLCYGPAIVIFICLLLFNINDNAFVKKVFWGYTIMKGQVPVLLSFASIWTYLLSVIVFVLYVYYLLKIKDKKKKEKAIIILIGLSIPLFFGVLTEVVLPFFFDKVLSVTNEAFAVGCLFIGYAIKKHSLFALNPLTVMENIVAIIPDTVIIVDKNNKIKYINKIGAHVLNYSEDVILGKNIDYILPDFHYISKSKVDNVDTTIMNSAEEMSPISLSKNNLLNKNGNMVGTVCICRDITLQKLKEKELKRYRDHLEDIVEERTCDLHRSKSEYVSLFQNSPYSFMLVDLSKIKKALDKLRKLNKVKNIKEFCNNNLLYFLRFLDYIKIIEINKTTLRLLDAVNKREIMSGLKEILNRKSYPLLLDILKQLYQGNVRVRSEGVLNTLSRKERHIEIKLSIMPNDKFYKKVLVSVIEK